MSAARLASRADSISALVPGLSLKGELVIVAAPADSISCSAVDLISGDRIVRDWASGSAVDSEDALAFTALHGVEPMIETFPIDDAAAALAGMESGTVRFRAVLEHES